MKIKSFIHDYFCSPFFNHFLMAINLFLFALISYTSLTLDARAPFNTINIVLVAIFMFTTLLYMILNKIKPRINVFVVCVLGLIITFLLSYIVNGFNGFPKTPLLLAIFSIFVFLWLDSDKRHLHFYLIAFLIASWGLLVTFAGFEFKSIIHPSFSERIGMALGNENDVARHLLFAFLINLYYVYASKNRAFKTIVIVVCFVAAYFVVLTGSISNLLLLLISFFIFAYYISDSKKGIFVVLSAIVVIGLIILLIFVVPALSSIKDRILSIINALFKIGDERPDSSALNRFNAMINGFRLFFESPVFGNGYNSVANNYMVMAHNNLAEIGADYGVFALLFEEIIILYPFLKDEKSSNKGKIFTAIFGFYILMVQLFLVVFNSKVESIMLPLLFVVCNEDTDFKASIKKFFKKEECISYKGVNSSKEKDGMVIVEIIPSLYPTNGAERLVMNLTKSFAHSKHKIILISLYSDEDNDAVRELKQCEDIDIYFLGKKKGFDFDCASRLKKLIKEINPDAIHCHLDSLVTVWLSKIYKNYKVFYTFHTLIDREVIGSKFKLKNIIYRHIFKKKTVHPIAISRVIKESVCNYYELSDSFVDVVYNGVPINQFSNTSSYAEREYDFIYIGRFINLKNPLSIISAFNNIQKDYPNSKMVMIGAGPLLEECKAIACCNILFTGFINDVSTYLANSKALVLYSSYEGNPMVINEAIASKCFVIATSVGGIPDVVNNNNGLLIEFDNNQGKLEEAMRNFLNNIQHYDELTSNNFEDNKSNVSIEKTISGYIDVFMGEFKQ